LSGFRDIADAALAAEYRARGWWGDVVLGDAVARLAAERGDEPAFVTDRAVCSWRSYETLSDRLAAVLCAQFDVGSRVAVWLPDGAAVHIAFLAAEKAGVTVVGLGSRAGDNEIAHLLDTTGAVGIITLAEHRGRETRTAPLGSRVHVVVPDFDIDPDGEILVGGVRAATPQLDPTRRLRPDDLFMLNSTSGTTGLPKIVRHTQNRWMYFHQKAVENGALSADDVFASLVPAPFGFGLWTAHFTPTLLGVPTVLTEGFSAERTLQLLERERVTVLCCVSTQFVMLLASERFERTDLSALRVMFTGGEMIPYEKARAFEDRTGATVLQFFGSNETGLLSGTRLTDPPKPRLTTAGRIVPEMQVRLFDAGRDVTPSGQGQPAGRGPALSMGYLDDANANAELYTADGWMLMGDVCRLDDDGFLSVVGRVSDFIIRGGKNISARQVEDAVATHPAVALSAAVARPDVVFGERVCAFVELRAAGELTLSELTAHLEAQGVAKELWPEYLVVLDALPRSSGGKVAKGELREAARAIDAT
jgi:acyl-CoA synthetase